MKLARMLAAPVGAFLLLVAVFVGGVYSGARWFPRHIIQPIAGKPIILPGEKVTRIEKVPGPIRETVRTIERTDTKYVFTTRPPELTPEQTKKAQEQALRRFILSMEIPAGQLIPCKTPRLVEGGMACGEPVSFRAEILEPSVGVFVPIVIPGEIARPTELRVEVKPEVVDAAPSSRWRVEIYPGFAAQFSPAPNAGPALAWNARRNHLVVQGHIGYGIFGPFGSVFAGYGF